MKIKKDKKYLFIDSKDVKRVSYEIRREFSLNDFENVYYQIGYESVDNYFEQYNIPVEFRKMVFEIIGNIPSYYLFKKKITELFSKQVFTTRSMNYDDKDSKLIYGTTNPYDLTKNMFFTTNPVLSKRNEVLQFIDNLNSFGLMDNYLWALISFFNRGEEKEIEESDIAVLRKKIETSFN